MKISLGFNHEDIENIEVSWNMDATPNKSILAVGMSGSGKSVFCHKLMREMASSGNTVIAINIHNVLDEDQIIEPIKEDFRKLANVIDVCKEGICCELFKRIKYPEGYIEDVKTVAGSITDIISRVMKLSNKEKSLLLYAVEDVAQERLYENFGFQAVVNSLSGMQTKASEGLAEKLKMVFSRNLFRNGKEEFLEEGKINIISFSRLDLGTQKMASEILLSYLWRLGNAGRFKDKGVFLFLDEVQNYDGQDNSPVPVILSEGRKMGIHLILATQMLNSGARNALMQRLGQAALHLYFKPDPEKRLSTAKAISPGNPERWSLRLQRLEVGQFVACGTLEMGGLAIDYPIVVDGKEKDMKCNNHCAIEDENSICTETNDNSKRNINRSPGITVSVKDCNNG